MIQISSYFVLLSFFIQLFILLLPTLYIYLEKDIKHICDIKFLQLSFQSYRIIQTILINEVLFNIQHLLHF
jgi:hypothetical protein